MRIALAAGAVAGLVVIAACTDNSGKSITAPSSGPAKVTTFSGGFAYNGKILVCVNGTAADFRAKFDSTGQHPSYGFSVLNNPPPTTVPTGAGGWWANHFMNFIGGGTADGFIAGGTIAANTCAEIYTVTAKAPDLPNPDTDAFADVDIRITGPAGSTRVSTDCDIDEGLVNPDGSPYASGDFAYDCDNVGDSHVWGNFFHGSKITFSFSLPVLSECTLGYPDNSHLPQSQAAFNESEVLTGFGTTTGKLHAWYSDEHALTAGVDSVFINNKNPTPDAFYGYNIAKMGIAPSVTTSATTAAVTGTPIAVGRTNTSTPPVGQANPVDGAGRPLFPSLYLTDITSDHTLRTGDWQQGGTPIAPNALYGTWKGALITIDNTKNPSVTTLVPNVDPAKNHKIVGTGGVNPPAAAPDFGYSTDIVWNIANLGLAVGHAYRAQLIVHDGDQNKVGGDTGEACINIQN